MAVETLGEAWRTMVIALCPAAGRRGVKHVLHLHSARAGSISARLGHGHARFTSNIRLRSSFAGPGEPLALNLKPHVGHPALAAIRAVRNHVPAALGLLLLLEAAERLARTGPISVNHRWEQALPIPCRARALISAPHAGVGRFYLSTYSRYLDRRIGRRWSRRACGAGCCPGEIGACQMWNRLSFNFGHRPISLAPRREFNSICYGGQMWNMLGFDFGHTPISLAPRREFNSICYGGQMWDRVGFDFRRRPISLAPRREFNS